MSFQLFGQAGVDMKAFDFEPVRAPLTAARAASVAPKSLQHELNHVALAMVRAAGVWAKTSNFIRSGARAAC